MNIPFLDLTRELNDPKMDLTKAFKHVLKRGKFILGEEVQIFERAFSKYVGVNHCVTCGNGTDALELALEVCNISKGDEVIIPGFGWVSPYTAVKRLGATPVIVDVDRSSGNIDPKAAEIAITPKTKAIIPIHLYGNPCDIEHLKELSNRHNLILIEDCAQAHGAMVGSKAVGTFGNLATFSFYPTKNLGALGDGGAIVTNNTDLANRIISLRDYGRLSRHEFAEAGRNSRLDEVQAFFLNRKLSFLDEKNKHRQQIATQYRTLINSPKQIDFKDSVFHQFPVLVSDCDQFTEKMKEAGIGTDIHYPFTIKGAFNHNEKNIPNAKWLSEHVVSIPLYPELTEVEISYICDHLKRLEHFIL